MCDRNHIGGLQSARAKGKAGVATPSLIAFSFSMHTIDRSMYRRPPSPVGGRPVARRRPREISLSQMQTTAPCSEQRSSSGFAHLDKWVSVIVVALYSAAGGGGGGTPTQHHHHHHHHRPTSSVMKSPADPPVPPSLAPFTPSAMSAHGPSDSRWLAQPHTVCASERHQDSVDPV